MALRPIVSSVVLAAALLGTNVLRDGGGVEDAGRTTASPAPATAAGGQEPATGSDGGAVAGGGAGSGASPAAAGPGPKASADPASPPAPDSVDPPLTAASHFSVWRHGPRNAKLVALTFDDGWNLEYTRRILAILESKETSATFFPVARAVLRHPRTWRQIAAAGFPIGNHSWNHDDLSKGSAARAQRDIERASETIERITGAPLFRAIRPPFGARDASFMKAARAAGMRAVVLWDVDPEDWTGVGARQVVKAALKGQRGSIIVMHTDKANTVKALPRVIDGLRARGYTFVTVGQLIGLPGSVPVFVDREQREFQNGR